MRGVLSIDPGLRGCGCALWDGLGSLIRAAYVKNTELKMRGPQAHVRMAVAVAGWARKATFDGWRTDDQLVLEFPRVYPNHSNKRSNDPNDLLELAGVNGAIAAWLAATDARFFFPAEWKGQVPEIPCARQVLKAIGNDRQYIEGVEAFVLHMIAREAANKPLTNLTHNAIDAVGIGLHHLGRF